MTAPAQSKTAEPTKVIVESNVTVSDPDQSPKARFIAEAILASQRNAIQYEHAMAQAGRPINQFYTDPTCQIADHVENLLNQAIDMYENYIGE